MRNWPYAYSVSQDGAVKGKFDVTVLPHAGANPSVGTAGGWLLGISKFSKKIPVATEFVRYMTSPGPRSSWPSTAPTRPRSRPWPRILRS